MSADRLRDAIVSKARELLPSSVPGAVNLTRVRQTLESGQWQEAGFKKKPSLKEMAQALEPLPPPYLLVRKGPSFFVLNRDSQELLWTAVSKRPGQTVGQLARTLPFTKKDLTALANGLLEQGRLTARITVTEKVALHPSESTGPPRFPEKGLEQGTETPVPPDFDSATAAFKEAYTDIGSGLGFVFIHQIRKALNWPRPAFDHLLDRLLVQGFLAAHPGNPGLLSAEQIADSFQDEFGELYLTVSWRKA